MFKGIALFLVTVTLPSPAELSSFGPYYIPYFYYLDITWTVSFL